MRDMFKAAEAVVKASNQKDAKAVAKAKASSVWQCIHTTFARSASSTARSRLYAKRPSLNL